MMFICIVDLPGCVHVWQRTPESDCIACYCVGIILPTLNFTLLYHPSTVTRLSIPIYSREGDWQQRQLTHVHACTPH